MTLTEEQVKDAIIAILTGERLHASVILALQDLALAQIRGQENVFDRAHTDARVCISGQSEIGDPAPAAPDALADQLERFVCGGYYYGPHCPSGSEWGAIIAALRQSGAGSKDALLQECSELLSNSSASWPNWQAGLLNRINAALKERTE